MLVFTVSTEWTAGPRPIDNVFWQSDEEIKINSDPEKPRIYDRSEIDREDIDLDEGLAVRTFFINLFEDSDSEKYPYTAL